MLDAGHLMLHDHCHGKTVVAGIVLCNMCEMEPTNFCATSVQYPCNICATSVQHLCTREAKAAAFRGR